MTKLEIVVGVVQIHAPVKRSAVQVLPKGPRVLLVVDRGWIFAGDLSEADGRVYLDNAIHVLSWATGGFAQLAADPKKAQAKLSPMTTRVDVPAPSEIFRVPVDQKWGL